VVGLLHQGRDQGIEHGHDDDEQQWRQRDTVAQTFGMADSSSRPPVDKNFWCLAVLSKATITGKLTCSKTSSKNGETTESKALRRSTLSMLGISLRVASGKSTVPP
jgi:hypothetical protein